MEGQPLSSCRRKGSRAPQYDLSGKAQSPHPSSWPRADFSPVVRIDPWAVKQRQECGLASADGVQGQHDPIHSSEQEEGEYEDECLVVLLPDTAVNPPMSKERKGLNTLHLPHSLLSGNLAPRCIYITASRQRKIAHGLWAVI